MTPTNGIKELVKVGNIKKFCEIFTIHKHHQTLAAVETGIAVDRIRTIIKDPGQMTVKEAYRLRTYFHLTRELFCKIIDNQIDEQDAKASKK